MLQHLLFAFLAIALPAWDFYATRRLKKNPGSAQKIGYYKTLCALLWIASVAAVATVGIHAVFTMTPMRDDAAWLFGHAWVRSLVETAHCAFCRPGVHVIYVNNLPAGDYWLKVDYFRISAAHQCFHLVGLSLKTREKALNICVE